MLGEEEFYMLLIPLVLWNSPADAIWAHGFIFVFILSLMVGDFFKNLFALPRPPLRFLMNAADFDEDAIDNRDFGWPSTHAANAVVVPFFLIHEFCGGIWLWDSSQPYWTMFINCVGLWWCLSITVSRLYLGVHSPTDVQGGMIMGGIILKLWAWFGSSFLQAMMNYEHTLFVSTLAVILFLLIHPRPVPPMANYTYQEVVKLGGFMQGFCCGAWLRWGSIRPLIELYSLTTVLRTVIGFLFFASSFTMVKRGFEFLFVELTGVSKHPPTFHKAINSRLIVVKKDIDYNVYKLAAHFLPYSYLGFMVTYLAPALFDYFCLWI